MVHKNVIFFNVFRVHRLAFVLLVFQFVLFQPDSDIMFQRQYALAVASELDLSALVDFLFDGLFEQLGHFVSFEFMVDNEDLLK